MTGNLAARGFDPPWFCGNATVSVTGRDYGADW
jgi:hypothetical protein